MRKLLTRTDILMDRIDEVRANSVTPEKFEETWGYSLKEHVDDMMDFIHELESKDSADRVEKKVTKKERLQPKAIPAAAAKEKTTKRSKDIQEEMKSLSEKIQNLVEKILTEKNQNIEFIAVNGIGEEENIGKIKLKKRRLSNKKNSSSWKLKLVAVKKESDDNISTGAPMVLRNLGNPNDDMSIVARKLSLKKKMLEATPITKPSVDGRRKVPNSIKGVQVPTKDVNILSVDVGKLDFG